MLNKILLTINTIRYLKLNQLYWQLKYRVKKTTYITPKYLNVNICLIELQQYPNQTFKYFNNNLFYFLNLEKKFDVIDWNFMDYGKLWNYNLEYFDYLNQDDIKKEEKLRLIHS